MAAKYYVYRNLHKGGFSIKHRGKVVARPKYFHLFDPELRVSEASQARARREGQRNVHAYVVGTDFMEFHEPLGPDPYGNFVFAGKEYQELYYNPYKYDTFVDAETRKPVTELKAVLFEGNKAYYV